MTSQATLRIGPRALLAAFAASIVLGAGTPALADRKDEINRILTELTPHSKPSKRRVERVPGYDHERRRIRIPVDYDRSVDVTVYFPHNSWEITPLARDSLEIIGEALNDRSLRRFRYLIAGHTNSLGSDAYNIELSVKRALAVRDYLRDEFGIDPRRLVVAGWGERRLKDRRRPRSAINRRVEISLIADKAAGYDDWPPRRSDSNCRGRVTAYALTFDNFNSREVTQVEDYLMGMPCYSSHRPLNVSATYHEYWYETNIEEAKLLRSLRLMLRDMDVDGQISRTSSGYIVTKISVRR